MTQGIAQDGPAPPSGAEALRLFVPRMVARHLAGLTRAPDEVREQRFTGAVMLADVSGFTALSERLAQLGPSGPEVLTRTLNGFFDPLIQRIHRSGGDVLKFAGDALVVVWPEDPEAGPASTPAALRAAACGLSLQTYAEVEQGGEERLRLKVSVGVGPMRVQHIGGSRGRWELLVTGEGLSSLAEVTHGARPGEVVLTRGARELLGAQVSAAPLEAGPGFALRAVHHPPAEASLALEPPCSAEALKGYIPEAVGLRYGAQGDDWLSELRPISAVFINFPNATYETPLERAQGIMLALQQALDRFEGTVNKISVDEKGVSVVAVFGTPPNAHPDDPARAVLAARHIQAELRERAVRHSVGIASGLAFCGVVGAASRREYTVLGDTVNLAARLMQAAHGELLCDATTAERAADRFSFEPLPPIAVKGKAEPVAVFRPAVELETSATLEAPLLGRDADRALLRDVLTEARASGRGGAIVIEGEAGLGKSRMMAEVARMCDQLPLPRHQGAADPLERDAPYFAWRPVLEQILGLGDALPGDRQARAATWLEAQGLAALGPLLNPLLSLELPETPQTLELAGNLRGENTRELLVRVLAARSERGPAAILIEDAHWFDGGSWWLAAAARERAPHLLLILSTRQPELPVPRELTLLLEEGGLLRLEPLSPEHALALACHRLGATSISPAAAQLIRERGGGHPYFTEELAYALRDSGHLAIEGGVANLDLSRPGPALDLPPTIHGVITQRVDRLPPDLQLTLKTASVVGRSFGLRVLREVHPNRAQIATLDAQLEELSRLDLTPVDRHGANPTYSFKHALTREAVYGAVLTSTRRELHTAVGAFYEREYAAALAPHGALLAYHWAQAGDPERARRYLELAGEQALQSGAPREAAAFLGEAIALEPPQADGLPARARRRRLWGEALLNSGKLPEARSALDQAVQLAGSPLPRARPALAARLLSHASKQLGHRLWGASPAPSGEARDLAADAAKAHERLAEVCFFQNQPEGTLFCTVAAVNLTEVAHLDSDLCRVYGSLALGTSLLRLPGVSRVYERLALQALSLHPSQSAEGWARVVVAMVQVAQGRWDEARPNLERSVELNERLGDSRRCDQGRMILAILQWLQGEAGRAQETVRLTVEAARRTADIHMQSGANAHLGYLLLRAGQPGEAADRLEEAARHADDAAAFPEQVYARGLLALARVRLGQLDAAAAAADGAVARLEGLLPTAVYAFEGYAALAEAALELAGVDPGGEGRSRAALAGLRKFAATFPIALPRLQRLEARRAALQGEVAGARRRLATSLRAAQGLHLPQDIADAQQALAALSPA